MTTAHSTPETPFQRFKTTYTPLYRTLLVLGAIAALFSLTSITNLGRVIAILQDDVFYALSGLITTLGVIPLMIASLILLIHKHPMGIRLRLAGYGVSIVGTALGFFTSEATLQTVADQAFEAASQTNNGVITAEFAADITAASFYGALYVSIGLSLLFAWLWWKAWQRQMKADAKKKLPS